MFTHAGTHTCMLTCMHVCLHTPTHTYSCMWYTCIHTYFSICVSFSLFFFYHFFLINFLSMWTYIHTPGIHAYVEFIYADYAMVYQKNPKKTTTPNNTNRTKSKKRKRWGQKYISKATSIPTTMAPKRKEGITTAVIMTYKGKGKKWDSNSSGGGGGEGGELHSGHGTWRRFTRVLQSHFDWTVFVSFCLCLPLSLSLPIYMQTHDI